MQEDSITPEQKKKDLISPEEDGRNIEWQDRARVNLEQVPEGTKTNAERDFEPENPEHTKGDKKGNATY